MKKGLAIVIVIILFFSCAQQNQPLTGGTKDTIAPQMIKSFPVSYDTSFIGDKIAIKFDEYFVLDNIDAAFFSSPPFAEKPKFKISRKKLIIHFKENLKDSVTYTLNFGSSIADLNEKNKMKKFEFVFSTYSEIDTLKVSGRIIDAYTFLPIPNVLVMLYDENVDSLPAYELPLYAAKTDTSGEFIISNIRQKKYKIFALLDVNDNFIFDEDENQIAFQDSLVFPYAKLNTNFDTLDSGTVVTKMLNDTLINDTLLYDSVRISNFTQFYPNDIELLFYTEVGDNQEIKRQVRTVKGGVKLFFTKQIIDDFIEINPVKENESSIFENISERFVSKDSIFFWFKNPDFFDTDTLKFSITYNLNDSVKKTDTLVFSDYDFATDSLPLKVTRQKQNISIFEKFAFISEHPLSKIDTPKIQLFKMVDTIVADAKVQNVSVYRPAYDSLVFVFTRPISDNFKIRFQGEEKYSNAYSWKTNPANDSVFCSIDSQSLAVVDTISLEVFYDNLFFFNQLVEMSTELKVPIAFQKTKKVERRTQDSIIFTFQKNLSKNPEIELLDFSKNDFSFSINRNILVVNLTNQKAVELDTLKFVLKVNDMKLLNGETKNYEDTVSSVFIFDHQKLTYKRRYFRSKMIFAFKKPWLETPELNLVSFNPLGKWYTVKTNKTNDTLFVNIHNERVKRLNNMNLAVNYFDINQHGDTLFFSDSIKLPVKKIEDNKVEIIGREVNLLLEKPVDFVVEQDSISLRKYYIDANYESGYDYFLKIDSAAFVDIYSKGNDTSLYEFKVFAPEDFAALVIDVQNIWAMLDTGLTIDTLDFFELPKGQAILVIEDDNKEIYKSKKFTTDKVLRDPMFLPGSYTLRIYYDENGNGKWDAGNYFKHIQPEKMFIYPQKLNLSEGAEEKIIWNLAE